MSLPIYDVPGIWNSHFCYPAHVTTDIRCAGHLEFSSFKDIINSTNKLKL